MDASGPFDGHDVGIQHCEDVGVHKEAGMRWGKSGPTRIVYNNQPPISRLATYSESPLRCKDTDDQPYQARYGNSLATHPAAAGISCSYSAADQQQVRLVNKAARHASTRTYDAPHPSSPAELIRDSLE